MRRKAKFIRRTIHRASKSGDGTTNSDLLCVGGEIEPIETTCVMTNDELAAVIERTHWFTRNVIPNSEHDREFSGHLKYLLEEQRRRATMIKIVKT